MADFIGGTGNDSLIGGADDDTFVNGGGRDTISGGDGNDTVTFNAPVTGGSSITGGAGIDTLRIVDFPLALTQPLYTALYPTGAPQSVASLTNSTVNGFEKIAFGGAAGGFNSIQMGFGGALPNQMAGVTDVEGSAAYDSLVLVAFNPSTATPITVTAPTLTLTNWSTPDRPYQPADVILVVVAGPGSATINGTNNGGLQVLNGAAGNDTLNGSDGMDRLNGAGGINQLYGGGGDDVLAISNTFTYINGVLQAPQVFTGAGSLFDGGTGTDWMVFGGSVNFQGTVSSIEGMYFGPATGPATIPSSGVVGVQPYTEVFMSATTLAQFASALELDGIGTLTIELADGESVDASAWTVTDGADITTIFDLLTETVGATVVGSDGDDIVYSSFGDNLITLGAGEDRIEPNGGNDTITDFTDGEDLIDLSDSDVYSYAELLDYLDQTGGSIAQVGSDVVISYSNDESPSASITLQNFSLADFDASDFIFATPSPFPLFLVGGPFDDTLNGGTANDTLDGGDGNDVLIGRGGVDSLLGGNGDDTFIFNAARPLNGFDVINGGAGTDTLFLREQPDAPASAFGGTLSTYVFLNTNSVEKLEFDGAAGNTINSFFIRFVNGAGGVPLTLGAPTTVTGSDGIDSIGFLASGGMGTGSTITISPVSASNWSPATKTYLAPLGDTVSLIGLNTPSQTFNYSLTANEANGAAGILQVLSSGAGNDTMNGSAGRELLVYTGGADQLFGNDGDDALLIANPTTTTFNGATPVTTTLTGAGALFNGGGGTDFLTVGGAVNFQGTLVSIEGIHLQPAYSVNSAATGSQARAQLTLSEAALLGMGSAVQFDGEGDVIVNLASGSTFSLPTGYVFLPGSDISFAINGAAGNEVIRMGGIEDTVNGGDGNDTIELTTVIPDGTSIDGGNGTDVLRVPAAAQGPNGADLTGLFLSGLETLQLASTTGQNLTAIIDDVQLADFTRVTGGAGTDELKVNLTSGGTVDFSGLTFTNWLAADTVVFDGSLLSDAIDFTLSAHTGTWSVLAGSGDDTVTGTTGNDFILGADGNDQLAGGAGADSLVGGDGDDTLNGGTGTNQLTGGVGNDVYVVESTTDVVTENAGEGTDEVQTALAVLNLSAIANIENVTYIGTGNARLTGTDGDNVITGGAGNDTLNGGLGNDTLVGLGGNDQLNGGAGDDTYHIDDAGDVIIEAGGVDQVATTLNAFTLTGGIENLSFTGTGNFAGTGNGAANVIDGGDGDDTLDGGFGDDTLRGGAGNDTYLVSDSGDVVTEAADSGTDTVLVISDYTLSDNVENMIVSGKATTTNTGNTLANSITGNVGANRLNGLDGDDTLDGSDGNDTLDGGTGNDSLVGGQGDDVFHVDSAGDVISENAAGGTDTVLSTASSYTLSDNIEVLVSQLGAGAFAGTGNAQANRIVGGGGADTLDGGDGDDTLLGGIGDDSLVGGGGNDRFEIGASSGIDAIHGGADTDSVVATANNVTLRLSGLSGVEGISANGFTGFRIAGTTGNDSLDFSGVTLTNVISIDGAAGNDQITGSAAGDNLIGNAGNDTLNGGDGADTLNGGFGNDSLVGGSGADTLFGGGGKDVMTGGADADVFRFTTRTDSSKGVNADVITDFQVGMDVIDLQGIDPSAAAGDQAYLFNGAGAFVVNGLAQVRVITSAGNTVVQLDHDGNGTSDMEIVLNGNPALTSSDFLL
jgi:Ca2+-binding RTX toxin-like protein